MKSMERIFRVTLIALAASAIDAGALQQTIPTPESVLGFAAPGRASR